MRIARHTEVSYLQNLTGMTYILDMVATRELQLFTEEVICDLHSRQHACALYDICKVPMCRT